MKYIEARVSEDAALRFFERRRFGNLYGLLCRRRFGAQSEIGAGKRLPYLERIWLPYYIITIRVNSHRGEGEVAVSVEGHSGSFAIFQMHDDLVEGDLNEEVFHPKLAEDEAIKIGRKELLRAILRRRAAREKPFIEETIGAGLFYYPYWVYYYERWGSSLDIRLQDALTGEKGGNRTKMGVLGAFASKAD